MQLAYQRYGAGPPLLILHGLLGSGDNWHTLSRNTFSEHYEVFTIDLRNHGRSPHSDVFDYPAMVEDLVAFMDAHGLKRAHVLGHSMGGKVAMHFALIHPALVDHLIVVDIAPKPYPPHHARIFEALRALDLGAYRTRAQIDAALARQLPEAAVRQFLLKNLMLEDGTYFWKINLEGIYRNYDRINGELGVDGQFAGPALFVRGGASPYIADEDETAITRFFPAADIITIEGAGHWIHAEKPDAFAEAVLTFLDR